jgi:hypothetical protein
VKVSLISTVKDASAHIGEFVIGRCTDTAAGRGGQTAAHRRDTRALRRAAGDLFTATRSEMPTRTGNPAWRRAHDAIAVTDADCGSTRRGSNGS